MESSETVLNFPFLIDHLLCERFSTPQAVFLRCWHLYLLLSSNDVLLLFLTSPLLFDSFKCLLPSTEILTDLILPTSLTWFMITPSPFPQVSSPLGYELAEHLHLHFQSTLCVQTKWFSHVFKCKHPQKCFGGSGCTLHCSNPFLDPFFSVGIWQISSQNEFLYLYGIGLRSRYFSVGLIQKRNFQFTSNSMGIFNNEAPSSHPSICS